MLCDFHHATFNPNNIDFEDLVIGGIEIGKKRNSRWGGCSKAAEWLLSEGQGRNWYNRNQPCLLFCRLNRDYSVVELSLANVCTLIRQLKIRRYIIR